MIQLDVGLQALKGQPSPVAGLEECVMRTITKLMINRQLKLALLPVAAATVIISLAIGLLVGSLAEISVVAQHQPTDPFSIPTRVAPSTVLSLQLR